MRTSIFCFAKAVEIRNTVRWVETGCQIFVGDKRSVDGNLRPYTFGQILGFSTLPLPMELFQQVDYVV